MLHNFSLSYAISSKIICIHCLFFGLYASLWKEFLFFLCNYISGIGKMWIDYLKISLGWAYPVPSILFHLSSPTTLSSSWWPFPPQVFSVFLQVRSPNLDLVLPVCSNKCQMDWNNHNPQLADCPLVDATCEKVCSHCCEGTLLIHIQVATHQDHPSCAFSCYVRLLHPRSSIYLC